MREWILYPSHLTVHLMNQGEREQHLTRTLHHPLASRQVLLQKALPSAAFSLWEVPPSPLCHQCFTWVGLSLSWLGKALCTRMPQDQKLGRTKHQVEKYLTSPPALQKSFWADGEICWCMIDSLTLHVPLLSHQLSPQQSLHPRSRRTPILIIRKPQSNVPVPSPDVTLQLCFITWGFQLFREDFPLRVSPWTLAQAFHCIFSQPCMLLLWLCQSLGAGGVRGSRIFSAASRHGDIPPLLWYPFPDPGNKT